MRRTAIIVMCAALATAWALATIAVYSSHRDARQREINAAVCVQVARIDGAISQTLKRSLQNLPKIQYYREHPAELLSQQREVHRSLLLFVPPAQCESGQLTRRVP